VKGSLYTTRFSRYIALEATGATVDGLPEHAFRAVPARLRGFEIEMRSRLVERPWALDASAIVDSVRGNNRDTGEPLPRLAPMRVSLALEASQGPWQGGVSLRRVAKQTRVPSLDVATPGHSLLNLWLALRTQLGDGELLWFARLDNALDELAYNATAMRAARELSPQPGRAFTVGVRALF
jgi:iron complex outermembrane receptor protein